MTQDENKKIFTALSTIYFLMDDIADRGRLAEKSLKEANADEELINLVAPIALTARQINFLIKMTVYDISAKFDCFADDEENGKGD